MTNMFGTPNEHEESVRVRMAQRDGTLTTIENPPKTEGDQDNDNEPVIPKVEEDMVVTKDGKMIPAVQFSPYVAERQRLEQEETRVLNLRDQSIMEAAQAGANGGNEGGNTGEEEPPPLKIPRIELPDDNEYTDETQRAIANGVNAIAEALENQAKETKDSFTEVAKSIKSVDDQSSQYILEQELAAVEAHYGVPRAELFAASKATGIGDPQTLAQLVLGQKAQNERIEEATKKAEEDRLADAGGIGGTTQGSPNGGDPPKREEVDWNDNEALARVYKVGQPLSII